MLSMTRSMAGFTGTIHSRCAMYSLRQSFWMVPPSAASGMPRSSAAARYIAHTIEAGPLIVIDVVTWSSGIRSNRMRMSASELTHRPEPSPIHRWMDAAGVGEGTGQAEVTLGIEVPEVVGRVERFDGLVR